VLKSIVKFDPVKHWNDRHFELPKNRDTSSYAKDKEKFFPRNSLVCDLGGGVGIDSNYFLDKGHEVYLLDISDYALKAARNTAVSKGLGSHLITKEVDFSVGMFPLEDGLVDIVYSRLALHYFPLDRMKEIFSEIYRILKNGGKAFIAVKSPDDKREMGALRKIAKETSPGIFDENGLIKTRFTKVQYKTVLKKAGVLSFEVRDCVEHFGKGKVYVKSKAEKLLYIEIIINKV